MNRRAQPQRRSFTEMVMHPWANLKRIQQLDRLPDRRVSRSKRNRMNRRGGNDGSDPIRQGQDRAAQFYQAIGVYAFEDTRIELYSQFHEMDFDAMIAAVLDAFATEATQLDYERRRVVWVEARNEEIQRICTRTLDRLGMDKRAFPICRELAKDGDVFAAVHAAPNEGVMAIKPYKPFEVARIEDNIGRLIGFAAADEQGNPQMVDQRSVLAHQCLHFRLPPKQLDDIYGAESSFLWGARIIWRQLQLMMDQVVIQRLLRRPDRILILMDVAGMSTDDAYLTCKDWERRLHRESYLNPDQGVYHEFGMPLDGAKDLVLPRGANNQTEITTVPATNVNDLMRDVDLMLSALAAGIGFPLGFVGRGERGDYNPAQTLSRQYQPFAKRCGRLQLSFLEELARLLMIDLGWNNLDPRREENAFTLHMASVAPIVELERSEVLQMRLDRMERGIRFGQDAGLNLDEWVPYVLEFWGGLSRDLVQRLYVSKGGVAAAAPGGGDADADYGQFEGAAKHHAAVPDQRALEEALLEELGTPADSTPHVSSLNLDKRQVAVDDRFIAQGGKPGINPLLERFAYDKVGAGVLAEEQAWDMSIAGQQYKAAVPRDRERMRATNRRRAVSRIDVMLGLAREVLR